MFLEDDDDDLNACGCGEEDCEECAAASGADKKDGDDNDGDDDYGDGSIE